MQISLQVKIGSALVHAEEFMSPTGHGFDKAAFDALMLDEEVHEWLAALRDDALLPIKRIRI